MKTLLLALAVNASAQTFEVASVKLTAHGRDAAGLSVTSIKIVAPGHLRMINASLRGCLEWAHQLRADQISGPDWRSIASGRSTSSAARPMPKASCCASWCTTTSTWDSRSPTPAWPA
jgi:hypothetical protein